MEQIVYQIDETKHQEVAQEIKKSIQQIIDLDCGCFDKEGIRIAMPSIMSELLQRVPNLYTQEMAIKKDAEGDLTMFGVKVIDSYENFIVVFHKDMPLLQNSEWKLIDLRKIMRVSMN